MSAVPAQPAPEGPVPEGPVPGVSAAERGRVVSRRVEQFVDEFVALRRQRARVEAAEIRLLARVGTLVAEVAGTGKATAGEMARRSLVAELACAVRMSEWTVTRLLTEATDLCARFAPVVDAVERGEISRQHAAVIHDAGDRIDDETDRAAYIRAALDRAVGVTPGRLGPVVRVLAERFLDRTLAERHADAAGTRRVDVSDLADGMAALTLIAEAVLVHGIEARLTDQARALRNDTDAGTGETPGDGTADPAAGEESEPDPRTMDQLRADVMTDLLLTGTPDRAVAGDGIGGIRATVQITIPVLTMTGAGTEPCLLAGYGPISPDTARILAAQSPVWERVLTDPATGQILAVDRYRPTAAITRFLQVRDEHCRFPGCRRRAHRCDIDHTHDHATGGKTTVCNLAHLCKRHHTLKHAAPWTVQQIAAGVLVWTSPSGRKHTDRPEPQVRFVPDENTPHPPPIPRHSLAHPTRRLRRRRHLLTPAGFMGADSSMVEACGSAAEAGRELAHALDRAGEHLPRPDEALRGAGVSDARRGAAEDDVAGPQRDDGRQAGDQLGDVVDHP
ncbi:hypothetical protein Microterr_24500 [Microbacterium terricola]|uniref:DUF222 domain-containing protein n=1 Tax=Microbacterium terricola TaxID=344163 RepID=A0ABM8E203_9MICO|nr:hypothetical protein Microterr_24500 [Microbacterium terricola]